MQIFRFPHDVLNKHHHPTDLNGLRNFSQSGACTTFRAYIRRDTDEDVTFKSVALQSGCDFELFHI